jgi:hypothetical protein
MMSLNETPPVIYELATRHGEGDCPQSPRKSAWLNDMDFSGFDGENVGASLVTPASAKLK